jgi:glycosyltransferase involved in cell wall biosynthesis
MLRKYRETAQHLRLLRGYRMIATNSEHMRAECLRHGFPADRVRLVHLYVTGADTEVEGRGSKVEGRGSREICTRPDEGGNPRPPAPGPRPWRLLFLGRMDFLKGGGTLLEALPQARAALDRPLHVTFAGEGPMRGDWQRQAARVQARAAGLTVEFPGWVTGPERDRIMAGSDLVVMPSLWPEPFGLSGPEAGLRGVPAVAFAAGGMPDWLQDGVNGHLAPADPPTAAGLAGAIVKCLRDEGAHARLCRGAAEVARRFSMERHLAGLMRVLAEACSEVRRSEVRGRRIATSDL